MGFAEWITCYALVNFMPHPPTPGRPHTPGGDLTLLLVPTTGAIDSCPGTDRFSVVAFLNYKIALAIANFTSYRAGLLLVACMKYALSHP